MNRQADLHPWISRIALGLLACLFFYAALAWGSTTYETRKWLDYGLFAVAAIYALGLALRRRLPGVPRLLWVLLGLPVIIGWFHALNPKFTHDFRTWKFTPIEDSFAFLPGSLDGTSSLAAMVHVSALVLAFVVMLDLSTNGDRLWILFRVVALCGSVVAMTGFYQKATMADSMLWTDQVYPNRKVFFAAFRYHGHAAAFLNLCWPAALALLLRTVRNREGVLPTVLWSNAALITFLAVFANTSKAGQALAAFGLVLAGVLFWRSFPYRETPRQIVAIVGAVVLAIGAVLVLPSLSNSLGKWSDLATSAVSFQGRSLAYTACLRMLAESGWAGFGPGTFGLAFPYYTSGLGEGIAGFWDHAHQDYLQVLIKWGYLGGAAIIAIPIIGLYRSVQFPSREQIVAGAKDAFAQKRNRVSEFERDGENRPRGRRRRQHRRESSLSR